MRQGPAGKFGELFKPGFIGKLRLKNRFIRAAMYTTYGGLDGSVTDRLVRHYRQLASGGAGLVVVEFCYVDNKSSQSSPCQLSIAGDEYVPGLSWLAMTLKQNGAAAGIQISHAGGQRYLMAPPKRVPSRAAWEAIQRKGEPAPEELTFGEIDEIIEAFGDAALRAKKASFDLVEVHACHGYLITEFLSAATNKRADRYGGSLENRMRFLIEIIRNIRKKVGPEYPIAVRLNGSEYMGGGISIEECIETAKTLEKSGVDVLHVTGGTHRNSDKLVVPMYWPRGYHVLSTERIKKEVRIPVVASGSITTPEFAQQILKEGKADFVSLARPLLADPFFPKKAKEGRPEDITPCIRCNAGCQGRPEGSLTCTVNVAAGKEDEAFLREGKQKRVAVIGGGPGGMEAARVAAAMGHQVTLFEKRELGGMLIEASVPEFKADLRLLLDYLSTQLRKLKVEVVKQEADAETIKNRGLDAVIIAAGGTSVIPDVPGMNSLITVSALDVLHGAKVGEEVIVLGGGFVGCETALFLAEQGRRVTIVVRRDQVLPEMDVLAPKLAFFEKVSQYRVRIETNTRVEEITEDGIIAADREGKKRKISADTVVLAFGLRGESRLYDELVGCPDIDVYAVGDYLEPRSIYEALHEGHLVARNL